MYCLCVFPVLHDVEPSPLLIWLKDCCLYLLLLRWAGRACGLSGHCMATCVVSPHVWHSFVFLLVHSNLCSLIMISCCLARTMSSAHSKDRTANLLYSFSSVLGM